MLPTPEDPCIIRQADYRETLASCEGRADLVCTSPPYVDARTYGADVVWTDTDYAALGDAVFAALRPGGQCLIVVDAPIREWRPGMGTERGFHPWRLMLDWAERVGFRVPDRLAYGRIGAPAAYSGRFRNDWEPLLWFVRPGPEAPYFNKTSLRVKSIHRFGVGKRVSIRREDGTMAERLSSGRAVEDGMTHRGTLWNYGTTNHGKDFRDLEDSNHPARFSTRLAEDVVRCFCPPGGLVVDPFVGSGTTALAAVRHGRFFFGGDLLSDPQGRPWADVAAANVATAVDMALVSGLFSTGR